MTYSMDDIEAIRNFTTNFTTTWKNENCSYFRKLNETHINCYGANKRVIEISQGLSNYLSEQFKNCTLFFNNSGYYSCPKIIASLDVNATEWNKWFSAPEVNNNNIPEVSSFSNNFIKGFVCCFVISFVVAGIFSAYKSRNKKVVNTLVEKPIPIMKKNTITIHVPKCDTPEKVAISNKLIESVTARARELKLPLVVNEVALISDMSEENYEKFITQFFKATSKNLDNSSQALHLTIENTFVENSTPPVKKINAAIQMQKNESLEKEAINNKFIASIKEAAQGLVIPLSINDVVIIFDVNEEECEKFIQFFKAANVNFTQ